MRISDWSSDVCSSDLAAPARPRAWPPRPWLRLRRWRLLGARRVPRPAAAGSLRTPARSPRTDPPAPVQRPGQRACDTQCRGAWHQRAPVRRLRRSLMRHVVFLLAALAAATAVQAQQTRTDTIYRCTNALGALTIQNGIPCPKGSKQEVQVVESPMVIPNYESPPPIVPEVTELEPAPEPQAPAVERPQTPQPEQLADAARLPPPPLDPCNTNRQSPRLTARH